MKPTEGYLTLSGITQHLDFSFIKTPRRALKARSKQAMAIKVFLRLYELMIEDVVENNVHFQPPVKKMFRFYVGPDLEARTRRLNKKEPNIFKKRFKQYVVYAVAYKNKRIRHRFVTIPKWLKDKLDLNAADKHKYLQNRLYS